MEDLRIENMTRSASGMMEDPGRGASGKRGLNRSILEQTWGMVRRQLIYKAESAGRELELGEAEESESGLFALRGDRRGEQRRREIRVSPLRSGDGRGYERGRQHIA